MESKTERSKKLVDIIIRLGCAGGRGRFHNLYYRPSIIRMITLRIMRWTGHAVRKEHFVYTHYTSLVGEFQGKGCLGDLGVNGRITLI